LRTKEYDFRNWKSFPSSLKLQSDLPDWWFSPVIAEIKVTPGSELTSRIFARQENVTTVRSSGVAIHGWDGIKETYIAADIVVPHGDHPEWIPLERTVTIPPEITALRIKPWIGSTLGPEAPGTIWYDDLEVYQNGELIYKNKFSNWKPYITGLGAVVGGTIGFVLPVTGAWVSPVEKRLILATTGIGAALGGTTGYLLRKLPEASATANTCPVCGAKLPEAPLGVDVKCPKCGFVSAWTRR